MVGHCPPCVYPLSTWRHPSPSVFAYCKWCGSGLETRLGWHHDTLVLSLHHDTLVLSLLQQWKMLCIWRTKPCRTQPSDDSTRKELRFFIGHCSCVSTLCLPDATACDQISQASPLRIYRLQVIKDSRWEWPGDEASVAHSAAKPALLPGSPHSLWLLLWKSGDGLTHNLPLHDLSCRRVSSDRCGFVWHIP